MITGVSLQSVALESVRNMNALVQQTEAAKSVPYSSSGERSRTRHRDKMERNRRQLNDDLIPVNRVLCGELLEEVSRCTARHPTMPPHAILPCHRISSYHATTCHRMAAYHAILLCTGGAGWVRSQCVL